MNPTRRIAFALAAFAVALGTAGGAAAQTYPNKPIRMIVPSTPGSPTDVMARLVAQSVSTTIGQPVLVEPRPGGGGIIGTKAVVNAEPDGYTLLFTEGAKHLMTPALYDNVGFDPVTDVTPVATAGGGSFLLVVAPGVPATTVKELVEYARANPGRINFGFGQGTLPHMLGETLKHTARVDISSIPYKGGAQAVADMLGGHIQMNFGTTATLLALIRQGKLRPLAVTNADPPCRTPRHADHGGERLSQPDAALLDGGVGAAAHAGRDRREAQRRDRRGAEIARACSGNGPCGLRADADGRKGRRNFHGVGIAEMARRREDVGREGRLARYPFRQNLSSGTGSPLSRGRTVDSSANPISDRPRGTNKHRPLRMNKSRMFDFTPARSWRRPRSSATSRSPRP